LARGIGFQQAGTHEIKQAKSIEVVAASLRHTRLDI
jgi:hypothetical protein